MPVIKEWTCKACGAEFDSELPVCLICAASEPFVVRSFRTAPGFKGDKTKALDSNLNSFTKRYGLSDFSNNQSSMHEKNFDHLWKPIDDFAQMDGIAGGRPDIIHDVMKEAIHPITDKKVVVGREAAGK